MKGSQFQHPSGRESNLAIFFSGLNGYNINLAIKEGRSIQRNLEHIQAYGYRLFPMPFHHGHHQLWNWPPLEKSHHRNLTSALNHYPAYTPSET